MQTKPLQARQSVFSFFHFPIFPINRSLIAKFLYLVICSGVIFGTFIHWAYDDPYITYRYAANLQHGLGFVYNHNESVLSTTTPLFTFLLALLGNLWNDLPHLANLLGALGLALGGLFLWDMARTWRTPMVGWSGLLLYPFFPLTISTLSSETPLYLAFCLGAFAFYARQRYSLTALFAALAFLTRPDGILVPAVLAAHFFWKIHRPIPWKAFTLFLALTLPWIFFAWAYFGSPFPVTLAAKQHQGTMAISQHFAAGLPTILKWYVKPLYFFELGLAISGAFFLVRRAQPWALFLSWTILYFVAYSLLGVSRYFWYYAPLVPGLIALAGLGMQWVSEVIAERQKKTSSILHYMPAASLMVLILFQISDLAQMQQQPDTRLLVYRAVGKWLHEQTPPNAKVGTLEVGIIGYYSQRYMLDFAGLIQPEVSKQLTKDTTFEDAALWAVEQNPPDYLVLHENSFPRLEKEYTAKYCSPLKTFTGVQYGYSTNLIIYLCQP